MLAAHHLRSVDFILFMASLIEEPLQVNVVFKKKKGCPMQDLNQLEVFLFPAAAISHTD